MKRIRCGVFKARSKVFPDGQRRYVITFGVKFSYWPCVQTPALVIAVWNRRLTLWYGQPIVSDRV